MRYENEEEDDDVEVEYVEEIEYVDDTDEEGSYVVEEYVDEEEVEEEEEQENQEKEDVVVETKEGQGFGAQALVKEPEGGNGSSSGGGGGDEYEEEDDDGAAGLEGQGQPPAEISYDAGLGNHMSNASLLKPEDNDDDDGVEAAEEATVEEEKPAVGDIEPMVHDGSEDAESEKVVPHGDGAESLFVDSTTPTNDVEEPVTPASAASANEPNASPPTGAGPRSFFQRRKSFGSSSARSVASNKSSGSSGSKKSSKTAPTQAQAQAQQQPTSSPSRPGLLRSGSSKSIRSLGKGIKNVFRRKSGKGQSKQVDNGEDDENNSINNGATSAPDEVIAAEEGPTVANNEREEEPMIEEAATVEIEEAVDAVLPSETLAMEPIQPTPSLPVQPIVKAAVVAPAPSSAPSTPLRIKKDTAPVSPSRSVKSPTTPTPTTTVTETSTTTTSTTTTVTKRVIDSTGAVTTTSTSTSTLSGAEDDESQVQYSYLKDGRPYYTDRLEKQDNKLAWKKPDWTSNSPLRKTTKGVVLKEKGTLAKPIVVPADKSVEAETGIGWSKPSWTKERVLKETEKGSAIKSGAEIARPITVHTNHSASQQIQ